MKTLTSESDAAATMEVTLAPVSMVKSNGNGIEAAGDHDNDSTKGLPWARISLLSTHTAEEHGDPGKRCSIVDDGCIQSFMARFADNCRALCNRQPSPLRDPFVLISGVGDAMAALFYLYSGSEHNEYWQPEESCGHCHRPLPLELRVVAAERAEWPAFVKRCDTSGMALINPTIASALDEVPAGIPVMMAMHPRLCVTDIEPGPTSCEGPDEELNE